MATRFLAPSMGEGIEEMTVVNWLKQAGDPVKEREGLVELETDKVTAEIPSPAEGTLLQILAEKDEVVQVGAILAWIGEPGETPEPDSAEDSTGTLPEVAIPASAAQATVPASAPTRPRSSGPVSPLVKKLATEHRIDLNRVAGTGMGGRITKQDVLDYLETHQAGPTPVIAQPPPAAVSPALPSDGKPAAHQEELIPHTAMRRKIAERMLLSQQTAPHVLTVMEADLSRVLAHRVANQEAFSAQGIHLTLTAYFCSAAIQGLRACPEVNAAWTDQGLLRYHTINLGLATDLGDEGLIVPVIRQAETLSLRGLAQQINDLSGRARAGKLLPEEVRDGTFTLTNHGSNGSLFAAPILFPPQAAILGVGQLQKRVIVITDAAGSDAIAIRPMVYLSLVFDHRVLDGAGADRFLKKVKETLEYWG